MNEKKKQEIPMDFKLDDFFTTQETRDDDKKEKVENISILLIDDFKEHPFKVLDNDDMSALKESIKTSGILSPVIIREKDNGRYEMLSGHRRKFACQSLGLQKIKCIIKNLSDDEATIFMVDSNLQREKLLPSEKAFAYKMKLDALKHQGTYLQHDDTSRQVGDKFKSVDILSSKSDDSARQIHRYVRLTYLIPKLLNLVDNSELKISPSIAMTPAVELSYLNEEQQRKLVEYIEFNLVTPSHSQAIQLRELSQKNILFDDTIKKIMNVQKPNQIAKFQIQEHKLYDVLP